jgi:hypothetical protein
MRGFLKHLGISGRPFRSNFALAFLLPAILLLGGCSGFVQGTNTAPVSLMISNIAAANATSTSVSLDWQTSAPATSQVEYGTTTIYGSMTTLNTTMVTSHQVTVSNLNAGTAYHCRVHSTDANNNVAVSGDIACSTLGDTTPPTVSITSPAANATVSGTIAITAAASDNVAVASVQFKVDSANSGSAVTAAPYSVSLNTSTLSDGNHILTAVATDTSGNSTTSAQVPIKVNNTTPAPAITSLTPASGLVGASVTISGANFGATQGSSTVTFNGTAATPTSWSASSIVVAVPTGATSGNVVVTVGGVSSNGVAFTVTVPAPSITSLNPTSGVVGTSVTITGANFGATQSSSTVKFNGIAATPTSWSAASILVAVPAGATSGNVVVTVGGTASNGVSFTVTVPVPSISSLNPSSGLVGASVTISGANFGATQGSSTIKFNGIAATPTSWSASSIVVTVPAGATSGSVVVTVGGVASNGVSFTVTVPAPSITSLNPTSGLVGSSVTISGANFGATQGSSTVKFNGISATASSWSASSITTTVPAGATTGSVVVTVGGVASNGVSFTVTVPAPSISSLNPTSGNVGASITISGANFGATQGSSTVKFNGTTTTPTSWSALSIVVPVPTGATSGNVVVTVGGVASNGVSFTVTVPAPSVTGLSPTSGIVTTSVTISGANFGATQGSSTVKFNGITATPTSWSAASIVAPVPTTATTGNVVVTVGGVASNGVLFTVTPDTTPPVVNVTAPTNGATVSGAVTLTATATDSVGISLVQFQVDTANVGVGLTVAPFTISWDSTAVSNGTHTITATATDILSNHATSTGVTVTVSNSTTTSMGPLVKSGTNSHYFVNPQGQAVFLSGSHTWTDFQDLGSGGATTVSDFNAYVSFLTSHGHNATILWRKDLPQFCAWGAGGVWKIDTSTGMPWVRSSTGGASDGGNKFDLNTFNQPYFDRLRARVIQLQQSNIYAVVQFFDGLQTVNNRCGTSSPSGDGYPFTGVNNINGVDDGYSSGTSGVNSYTMSSNNAISNYQDAYVKKLVDTLNDLPNVIWEISEEGPSNSANWWAPHMIGLLHAYEGGGTFEGATYTAKPFKHPVGWPTTQYPGNDSSLYGSAADWIAPTLNASFPSVVATNNQGKVVFNDSDHALAYTQILNSDGSVKNQPLRGYAWENFTSGAGGVVFMDPYEIYWQGSPVRNTCVTPVNAVCTGGPDTKYDPFRNNLGYIVNFATTKLDLVKMTPQGGLSSTGFCLAQTPATGAEYLVYAPNGGTFTVNLSATSRVLNIEWFNPSTGATTSGGTVTGGLSNQSFSAPFSGDAVLYLVDAAGHN